MTNSNLKLWVQIGVNYIVRIRTGVLCIRTILVVLFEISFKYIRNINVFEVFYDSMSGMEVGIINQRIEIASEIIDTL